MHNIMIFSVRPSYCTDSELESVVEVLRGLCGAGI